MIYKPPVTHTHTHTHTHTYSFRFFILLQLKMPYFNYHKGSLHTHHIYIYIYIYIGVFYNFHLRNNLFSPPSPPFRSYAWAYHTNPPLPFTPFFFYTSPLLSLPAKKRSGELRWRTPIKCSLHP